MQQTFVGIPLGVALESISGKWDWLGYRYELHGLNIQQVIGWSMGMSYSEINKQKRKLIGINVQVNSKQGTPTLEV